MRARNSMLLAVTAFAIAVGLPALPAQAETIVRYGISMADIPLTTGQPDRGAGAYQFSAYTIYHPLVAWEMDVSDRPGKLVPGLATEWKVDDNDKTKWRFKLRQGVKFHDGSDSNAGSVDKNQCAAGGTSRPDRDAGARRGAAAQIRGHADRRQHHAARVELSSQRAARLALDRHKAAQGAQSRDRSRRGGRADERPGQTRQRSGRSVEPVVRQADLRTQIRSCRRQEARRGGRLFQGKAAEDDIHHRPGRNGANAVAADERIFAAKFQGNRHRYRLQGGRTRNALYALAQGRGGRDERRHYRQ